MKHTLWALLLAFALASRANAADIALPAQAVPVAGAPVEAVGCTAQRTDSEGGYLSDYYIRGNASFVNHYVADATSVLIELHYAGAYGDHDAVIEKHGQFSPGVRIDPKRRAWVAMLQPEALNTDIDGIREIDIWGVVSATCTVVAAQFADGTSWRLGDTPKATSFAPAPMPTPKCSYDSKSNEYVCR